MVPLIPFYAIGVGLLIYKLIKTIPAISIQFYEQLLSRVRIHLHKALNNLLLAANNLVGMQLISFKVSTFINKSVEHRPQSGNAVV